MFARVMRILLLSTSCGSASAGQFDFAPAAVAGSAGGSAAPLLTVSFRGDGETTDAQVFYTFDTSRFSASATARNGALCVVSGNQIRVISPGSLVPLNASAIRYCEIQFAIAAATLNGSYSLAILDGTLGCFTADGAIATSCIAANGNAAIRVGQNTPEAQFTYLPAANSTLTLSGGSAEISVDFVPGGFGAAIELHDCQLVLGSGASFGPVAMAPLPLAFVSDLVGTGLIGLSCNPQIPVTSAVLACTETRNGSTSLIRQWDLQCPALPADLIMQNGFEG